MVKKIIAFTPADKRNLPYFKMMEKTLRKFISEEQLPLLLIDEKKIATYNDPRFFYKATPTIAKELMEQGAEIVIKIDADSLIVGDISELLLPGNSEYDIAVVNNSNPMENKKYPYAYRNIHPYSYVNCGFVVMRSKPFVDEWYDWCNSMLANSQMVEQDGLNDLVHGNHYKVKRLDEGDSYYGLAGMGYYGYCELINNEIILKKGDREWPPEGDKKIKIVHFAGGNDNPAKMNYIILFNEEIIKYIDNLVK